MIRNSKLIFSCVLAFLFLLVADGKYCRAQTKVPEQNFKQMLGRIEAGLEKYKNHNGYVGEVILKERVNKKVLPIQKMKIKIIDDPFKVHMKWVGKTNKNREVYFATGENDNKLKILNPTPLLKGPISLSLESRQVTSQFRYPITQIGILSMARRLQKDLQLDLAQKEVTGTCEIEPDKVLFKGTPFERKATQFILTHADSKLHPIYRKRIVFIDDELNLPIQLNAFTWPQEEDAELEESKIAGKTFIEGYQYRNINFTNLSEDPFDFQN